VNWSHLGAGWGGLALHFHELQHYVRGWGRVSHRDPDQRLPDVEISDSERQNALDREFARRTLER